MTIANLVQCFNTQRGLASHAERRSILDWNLNLRIKSGCRKTRAHWFGRLIGKSMNLSYKILIGLFAGCLFGLFIAQSESQWLNWLPALMSPIGSLWINAIRMTIVPLLMSLIIVAIGGIEQSLQVLAIGGRSLCMFAGLILLSSGAQSITSGAESLSSSGSQALPSWSESLLV